MFKNCKSLKEVLGISSIYLSKVEDYEGLFDGCDLIKSSEEVKNFKTILYLQKRSF